MIGQSVPATLTVRVRSMYKNVCHRLLASLRLASLAGFPADSEVHLTFGKSFPFFSSISTVHASTRHCRCFSTRIFIQSEWQEPRCLTLSRLLRRDSLLSSRCACAALLFRVQRTDHFCLRVQLPNEYFHLFSCGNIFLFFGPAGLLFERKD